MVCSTAVYENKKEIVIKYLKLIYRPENDIDIVAPFPERRGPPRR